MADQENTHGLLTLILSGVSIVAAAATTVWVAISQRRQNRDTTEASTVTAREQRIADSYTAQLNHLEADVTRLRTERDNDRVRADELAEDLERAYATVEGLQDRIEDMRRAHDSETGALKLALAQEERHKNEALEDAANVKRMFDDALMAHRIETETMRAELLVSQWHVKSARVWIVQVRETWYVTRAEYRARGDFGVPDVPAAPQWVDGEDEPPAPDES